MFVLLIGASLKPLNSPLKIQTLYGHQAVRSGCILGMFNFVRSHQEGSCFTEQNAPGISPAPAGREQEIFSLGS